MMVAAARQEKWLRNGSLVALWLVCVSFVATYAWLTTFLEVDILIPLKTVVIIGFFYWIFYSVVTLFFHLQSLHLTNPVSLCLKLASLPVSAISAWYALPPVVELRSEIEMHPFETYVMFVYAIGAFAVLVGLTTVTYYARRAF
jgi:hypothetical protein